MDLQLRSIRRAHGMSQQALADALHVNIVSIGNWERGSTKISLESAVEASHILGVDLNEMAGLMKEGQAAAESDSSKTMLAADCTEEKLLTKDELELLHIFRDIDISRKASLFNILRDVHTAQDARSKSE